MVPAVGVVWGFVVALAVIPATIVAYLDFAERSKREARRLEERHAARVAPNAAGVKFRVRPVKGHKVEGAGPLV